MIGLWYVGLYAGVWFMLADLRRRGLPGRWLTDAALLTAIPVLLIACLQIAPWFPAWLHVRREGIDLVFAPIPPTSTIGNPNLLGAVLAMLIPLGLVRARRSNRRLDRFLWGLWLVLASSMLYLTYSRGAWMGAGASLITLGGLAVYREKRHLARRIRPVYFLPILVLIAVLLVLSASVFDTPRRGVSERFDIYGIAVQEFRSHPLTGTGLFTFGLSLLNHRSVPPLQPHAHAHNLILNVAAELGLAGLVAFLVTGLLIVRHGWRSLEQARDAAEWEYRAAGAASLIALLVHSMVDMPLMAPGNVLLMLMILAAWLEPLESSYRSMAAAYRIGAVVLWLVVLGAGWWFLRVDQKYNRGLRLLIEGNYSGGAESFKQVASTQPSLALYDAQIGYACGLAAYHGDGHCLQEGIRAYERALATEQPHAIWWANLAALYRQAGQADQAVEAMQQAAIYAPDEPDMWLNLGLMFEQQGQVEQAQDAYRHVLEARSLWGRAEFWDDTPLRQEVRAGYPIEPGPYQSAITFWTWRMSDRAVGVLEDFIAQDRSLATGYLAAARYYVETGQPDDAQNYLDAASLLIRTEPDWRAWVYYLRSELAQGQAQQDYLDAARELMLPDETGLAPFFYANDIAHFHFWHLATRGMLLPQLIALGPDPVLLDLLR